MSNHSTEVKELVTVIKQLIGLIFFLVAGLMLLLLLNFTDVESLFVSNKQAEVVTPALQVTETQAEEVKIAAIPVTPALWKAPSMDAIRNEKNADLIEYGRNLISNTAAYLGPKGSVAANTNGMNCQNCHLQAGTFPYGNNYSAVFSTYPKYRARSGTIEGIEKRVNDCMERSLNGKPLADNSREMKAIKAYIEWLGKEVPKGEKPEGSGLVELAYLERPADPAKGKLVYDTKCAVCHKDDGSGVLSADAVTYQYPPLWGDHSYNTGAGLYRLSRFAGYVKANMPLGATYAAPQLTDEEAWDLAAFVNTMPRPKKDIAADWPKIEEKPIDHPFGPFADGFDEKQHKYGPFGPIAAARKKAK